MLSDSLVETLINRKIVDQGTVFDVELLLRGNTGSKTVVQEMIVNNIINDKGHYKFVVYDASTKQMTQVDTKAVHKIDGMDIPNLVKAYDLNIDGSKKILGKRRGRPRKHPLPV